MDNARMELEQKIAAAGSPEEIKRILNDAGAKIGPEDAAKLYEKLQDRETAQTATGKKTDARPRSNQAVGAAPTISA